MWCPNLDRFFQDPENSKGGCHLFEYRQKRASSSDLSGVYNGWFGTSRDRKGGQGDVRINEKGVKLEWELNSEGYYNVQGKGTHFWGRYRISGIMKDDEIVLFRDFEEKKKNDLDDLIKIGKPLGMPGEL
jgi:hypothetical protein